MNLPISLSKTPPNKPYTTLYTYSDTVPEGLRAGKDAPNVQRVDGIWYVKVDEEDLEKTRRTGCTLLARCKELQEENLSLEGNASTQAGLALIEGFALKAYQFTRYKSEPKSYAPNIYLTDVDQADIAALEQRLASNFIARNLVNEPQNVLTATQLGKEIEQLAKESGFTATILKKKDIEKEGMGGLLAVNKGSVEPPTFCIMDWNPKGAEKTLVLVGKGVVYDTGGLSLKPTANSMDFMKSDMAGSAAVIGAMHAIAKAKLPVRVIALVAATDNRPSGAAYAPGDVITMYSGKTVEVLNTDAEGRLTLADALHYAKQYKPNLVIDMATLTGAAARAIGPEGIAMMGTADEETKAMLSQVGHAVCERVVEFPLWDDYDSYLSSTIADLKNIGGPYAGAITAGKFLQHFIDYPWIHLDIAGSAFLKTAKHYGGPGATGVGARLLLEFARKWSYDTAK